MSIPSSDFLRAARALDEVQPAESAGSDTGTGRGSEPDAAIDENLVWEVLATVIDPEIGLDIVTLGLVYVVEPIESAVRVTFTLTTPGCPMEEVITSGIVNAVSAVPGVEHVLPNLVWEPRWHPGMVQEGAW
jgi:metal-sulfur cluster biosynthetic enzyme